jgi:hypothetical protein
MKTYLQDRFGRADVMFKFAGVFERDCIVAAAFLVAAVLFLT